MTVKLKRYGKNLRGLKKLLTIPETRVFKNGYDWTEVFKNLLGYEYNFCLTKKGLEITDITGETLLLTTTVDLEVA